MPAPIPSLFDSLIHRLAGFFNLPTEISCKIFSYIPIESLADIGASQDYINYISRSNPPLQITNPILNKDVIKNFEWFVGNDASRPKSAWFICHPRIFTWYLVNIREEILETLNYRQDEFDECLLLDLLIHNDRADLIKILNEHAPDIYTGKNRQLSEALEYSKLDCYRFLNSIPMIYCDKRVMDTAAEFGHIDVLKDLHDRSKICSTYAIDTASENGHLDCVQFLSEQRTEGCTLKAMNSAARNGHMDVVKYLHENRVEGCTNAAIDKAARRGHANIVAYLSENRKEGCTENAMNDAALNGHYEVVKYLHENRNEGCTNAAIDKAAKRGHLDVVAFLSENRTEGCSVRAIDQAASQGHLEIVKYLLENRDEGFSSNALESATRGDHLEILDLLELHHQKFIL